MDLDLIERLMQLLDTSTVNELELTENGTRIRLSKTATTPLQQPSAPVEAVAASSQGNDIAAAPAAQPKDHVVIAGLSGTFYRSPLPGEPVFVSVGDAVEDGRKLGIIEAMKMMNPVEADCDGRIGAIHLDDGAPVTAGMTLFTIERTKPDDQQ